MTIHVQICEAICTKSTPAGDIRLHVPVFYWRGKWRNANTLNVEPWVHSADSMAGKRLVEFLPIVACGIEKLDKEGVA